VGDMYSETRVSEIVLVLPSQMGTNSMGRELLGFLKN
jgi:hypothetical protein